MEQGLEKEALDKISFIPDDHNMGYFALRTMAVRLGR